MQFYTYLHSRPETVKPEGIFYVGKGTSKRVAKVERRNRYHQNIVAKYGIENIIVTKIECSSEEIALELEKGLIKCLRKMNVNLTNRTEGGDGVSGLIFSEESKERMSESATERFQRPEEQQKQSEAQKKRFQDPEQLRKHREATCNPKTREKQASKTRGQKRSPEARAKMSASAKKRLSTPEAREAHSERMKKAWADPEKASNMSTRNRDYPTTVTNRSVIPPWLVQKA